MKLKIGHLTVPVVRLPDDHPEKGLVYGLYEPLTTKISLCPIAAPAKQAETLIHEILHAIYDAYGLGGPDHDEETVCSILGRGLAQVIKDNAALGGVLRAGLVDGSRIVR